MNRPSLLRFLPFLALALPASLTGQVADPGRIVPDSIRAAREGVPGAETAVQDTARGISPKGAFIRSAIIPGWGHALVGAHGRGSFYFLMESVAAFMIVKTRWQLNLARERRVMAEAVATARLNAQDIVDPLAIEELLLEDPVVTDRRGLEEARSGQQEDWMALGIFFLFLGGADAYVSAHLADFPGAVEIGTTPSGGMEVGVSLPVSVFR
jgi:hypothetical protein